VGRLDDSNTEEELHEYLTSVEMKGVVCKRLVPKNGRVFKTAAYRPIMHDKFEMVRDRM